MARLLERAANVVLSTTTSRGLAALLGEGKRFDWCLVEEAGKVHGFDLALPMLASHRMLLIGDHEQLPAFNEAAYRNLLADPQRARDAITNGAQFIPRRLGFDLGPIESDEAMQAFESRCARWLPMVRTFGHVFQEANALPPGASPISARLNEQHRMHPEICDLLRACFYPDLRTADAARERLEGPDPFQLVEGAWLPNHRIVFVDMPWVQSVPGAKGQDTGPNGRLMLSSRLRRTLSSRSSANFCRATIANFRFSHPTTAKSGSCAEPSARLEPRERCQTCTASSNPSKATNLAPPSTVSKVRRPTLSSYRLCAITTRQ
jgi:hypothetical protein